MSITSGVKPGQALSAANDQRPVTSSDIHRDALTQAGINFTLSFSKTSGEKPAQFVVR